HSSRVAAQGEIASDRRRNVRPGDKRPLTFIPGECSVSGRVSVCVTCARPRGSITAPWKVVPDENLSVFGALIGAAAVRAIREQQQCTQNSKASPDHNSFSQPRATFLARQTCFRKARKHNE